MTTKPTAETLRQVAERRPVPGYEGYEADSEGTIWRLFSTSYYPAGRMQTHIGRGGYFRVSVRIGKKHSAIGVHRLVALAFHGVPEPGMHARHLDGNCTNNRAENIAWGTAKENSADAIRHGTTPKGDRNGTRLHPERLARGDRHGTKTKPHSVLYGEKVTAAKLTESQVREIVAAFQSGLQQTELARRFGVSLSTIHDIITGRSWAWLNLLGDTPRDGRKHWATKLNVSDVAYVLSATHKDSTVLAHELGVHPTTVQRIRRGARRGNIVSAYPEQVRGV